jgi:HK97 family phage portal protein
MLTWMLFIIMCLSIVALIPLAAGLVWGVWQRRDAVQAVLQRLVRAIYALGYGTGMHLPSETVPSDPAALSSLTRWRARRARRYLQTHASLALDVLRRDPDVAATALLRASELEAARRPPSRESAEYPVLATMGYGGSRPTLRTLPKLTPWNMRRFSEQPPARRAINAITNPILDLPFSIELRRPVGKREQAGEQQPTEEQQRRIEAVTEMLLRPNNDLTGRQMLEMVLEDLLVFGAGPLEVQPNMSDERPLFLFPVDAQSIRINVNWHPGSREFRYSQGRGYVFSSIGTTEDVKLQDEEMLYIRLNPRTSTPFGYGYLEVAFETITAFLGAFEFATRRASNATPNFGIFLGENVTIDQVRRWQHYWENEIEGYGKVPILGGGRQPNVFSMAGSGEDPLWLKWQEWLIRIVAMSFGISPMRLGLERDINRTTAEQGSSDDWATIAPVANTVRDAFTHWVLWRRLGWYDLEFQWQVKTSDELRQAEVLAEQYNMNGITVDEVRQHYERPPLADGLGQFTKTPYEAMIKSAVMPQLGRTEEESEDELEERKSSPLEGFAWYTPFDEERDVLSPQEAAFVRALMRQQRRERAVAG